MAKIVNNVDKETVVVLTNPANENSILTLKAGQGVSSETMQATTFETHAEALKYISDTNLDISYGLDSLPEKAGVPLIKGLYYRYGNKVVVCRQDHERTIYAPEDTPALFYFFRENPEGMEWIAQEMVGVGDTRTEDGVLYEALQEHVTQDGWEPSKVPALWKIASTGEIPVWVQPTGGHDAYNTGDEVMFPDAEGTHYRSLIDANVWSPTAYPAGWEEVV